MNEAGTAGVNEAGGADGREAEAPGVNEADAAVNRHLQLLFLVGLTGSGKSTVLPTLVNDGSRLLLPERRQLTDLVIIPAAQALEGMEPAPVRDRLERFRLTALYRREHAGGIVHALSQYLSDNPAPQSAAVFDGLRGLEEVEAAIDLFPAARFLMLEASQETRLQRLAVRADAFDGITDDGALEQSRRIVLEEQRHYDQQAARERLESLPPSRRLLLDTDRLSATEVAGAAREWL